MRFLLSDFAIQEIPSIIRATTSSILNALRCDLLYYFLVYCDIKFSLDECAAAPMSEWKAGDFFSSLQLNSWLCRCGS